MPNASFEQLAVLCLGVLFLNLFARLTRSRRPAFWATGVVMLLGTLSALAQAPVQVLKNHLPPVVANGQAAPLGLVPDNQTLYGSIVLPLRNEAELTALLGRLYDKSSPDYHHFLTVDEFTQRFGPTTQDYQQVVAFAHANGLTITAAPANRLIVPFSGPVSQVNRAFNVRMQLYQHPSESRTFFSPDREPSVNLGVSISHISGLNSYNRPHPAVKFADQAGVQGQTLAGILGSGPSGSYLGSDMRAAYYGGTTLTGVGQVVGILEFGGYNQSDVDATFTNAGQTYSVPINNVLLDGASAGATGDDTEQVLDIVQAIGMAPGLSQVRVYIGPYSGSIDDANILNTMASENIAKQLSCSWGWRPEDPAAVDPFFQEFAAQGQSFLTSSGDDGAFDSSINPFFFPQEDAYVTAVGGTHLTTSNAGGAWASESAWNSGGGGTGGGISPDAIPIPGWQTGAINAINQGSLTLRNVPDVAMEADFDNYYCGNGTCSTGGAGTSFAAPRWAGFMALVNQQAVEAGNAPAGGIGFINPTLYAIGLGTSYNADLHDVASGNNKTGAQTVWYSAVTGYDLTTGWGSPTGQALIDALAGPQVPGFWLQSSAGTLNLNQGGSATATITIANAGGFSGNINLSVTGLPAGVTASWSANPTNNTSVLTLTASGTVQATTSNVTITGLSGTLTSSTNVLLKVHAPTFNLVPTLRSVQLNPGTSSATTITVSPQYGFTGNVSLSVSGLPAGVTASFGTNPTTGTSVLTFTGSPTAPASSPTTVTVTGTSGNITVTATLTVQVLIPNFSLTGQTSTSMGQTASSTYYVSVNPQNGFSGAVNLAVSGLPAGVTASFATNPATSYSYLTFTSTSATPGNYPITITGTSGSLTNTLTFTLQIMPPTFTLSAYSTSVGQGSSSSTYVYIAQQYGFSSNVNLSLSGLPAGVTASFSSNPSISNSTITLAAAANTTPGTYTVTVTGTSGTITASTTFPLTVAVPGFTVYASNVSIGQGKTATDTAYIYSNNGFNSNVNLSLSGLPAGVTAAFALNPVMSSELLTLSASASAVPGTYTVTLTGTSGTLTASATFSVSVYAPTFSITSYSTTLGQGGTATQPLSINSLYGFTGSPTLSISGLPTGVTGHFTTNPTSAGSSLVLNATATAANGNYPVTITGTYGTQTVSTTTTLTIATPGFTLSGSSAASIGQGSTASSYLYINPINGFNGSVAFTASGLPSGVTATFSPNPSGSSTYITPSFAAASTTPAGTYPITITGTSGSLTASTNFQLTVAAPSFSLSGYGGSLGRGSSASYPVYVYAANGFNAPVNISASNLPAGITVSFSPTQVNPSGSNYTYMLVTTSSTAAIGTSSFTVTGTSGSLSSSVSFSVTVTPPSFSVSTTYYVSLPVGQSYSTPVYLTPQSGFTGNVTYSASGLPSGVTAAFSPNPSAGTSSVTFTASNAAAVGSSTITITGTSGTLTASTTLNLTVAQPSFTLSTYGVNLGQGQTTSSSVSTTANYGFSGAVNLSISGLPAGVTAYFGANPIPSSGSTPLTFTAAPTAPLGQYYVSITGTSGTTTVTQQLVLQIYPPAFTLSTSSGVSLGQGSTQNQYVWLYSQYGFSGNVTLSVSGLPSGVTAQFAANPVPTSNGSTVLILSASQTAVPGQYPITVSGTSGTTTVTAPITLTVNPPGFTLSASSVAMNAGSSTTQSVYMYSSYGSGGPVSLSLSGLPAGVSASFSPNPTTGSSILTLTTASNAAQGEYTVVLTGTSGSATAATSFYLTVNPPSFSLSGFPTTLTLARNSSATSTVAIVPVSGFNGSATLAASGLPAGVTAAFSPNPTSGAATLTLTADSSAPLGLSNFTVTATSGYLTPSLAFSAKITSSSVATSLAVSSGGQPATSVPLGSVVTLTASVVADGTTSVTKGQVRFCDASSPSCADIHLLGTAQLTSAGTAVLIFTPPPGIHSYRAVFGGNPNAAASSSAPIPLSVTSSVPSETFIFQAGAQGNYTLTANVTPTGLLPPTGTISFLDTSNGNALVGTAILKPMAGRTTHTTNQSIPAGNFPYGAAQADFNGDGLLDVVVVDKEDSSLTVLMGNGDATFTKLPVTTFIAGQSFAVVTADFNSDGKPDLAVAGGGGIIDVLLGNGDGTFTLSSQPPNYYLCYSIYTADFNGDGIPDLAASSYGGGFVNILLGNGDGTFQSKTWLSTATNPRSIAIADFNGDGVQDLAVANQGSNTVTIYPGQGDGTFGSAIATYATGPQPDAVITADFNGDNKPDLAVANLAGNTVSILLGNGDGTFTTGTSISSVSPNALSYGDFNGDGQPDLAVGSQTASQFSLFGGNGDGTFTPLGTSSVSGSPWSILVGNYDRSGSPGLAITTPVGLSVIRTYFGQWAVATLTGVAPTTPGTHLIEASYPGDNNYAGSTSPTTSILGPSGSLAAASINVSAAAPINGTGTITLAFNGFSETVRYDSSSSVKSIASAFAARFSRDFLKSGLCAAATGGNISFKLKQGTFQPISITDTNAAFNLTPTGFP